MEVPISVSVPPRMVRKDSGISSRVEAMPSFLATSTMIGMKTITTGVLFMTAEARTTPTPMIASVRTGRCSARETSQDAAPSSVPVRTSAPDSTNIAAMVIGAGLAKTELNSWPVR